MRSDISVILEIPEIYGNQSSRLSRPRTETSPCCRLSYEASAALLQPRAAGSVMDGLASFMTSFFDSIKADVASTAKGWRHLRETFRSHVRCSVHLTLERKDGNTDPGREHASDKVEPRLPYLPWDIKVILLLPIPELKHRLRARNLTSLVRRV